MLIWNLNLFKLGLKKKDRSSVEMGRIQMKKRLLGRTGFEVAPLALGGNVFGWTIDQKTSFNVLDAFVDLGLNLIDTANMYSTWVPGNSGGESEEIIGNWLKSSGHRSKIVLATKVGMPMGDGSKGLKKDYILKSVDASLKRLKTDVIDLYQSHQDDEATPIEETLEAYSILIKQGKIRSIGSSNFSPERLKKSIEVGKKYKLPIYATMQPEYNLYDRSGFEHNLEYICEEEGLGVLSYYSLASGFLTGKYRTKNDLNKSVRGVGIGQKYLNEKGFSILSALDEISKYHRTTPSVVSLAWLIQRKSITAPIASATSVEQIKEISKSTVLKLTKEQVDVLDLVSSVAK